VQQLEPQPSAADRRAEGVLVCSGGTQGCGACTSGVDVGGGPLRGRRQAHRRAGSEAGQAREGGSGTRARRADKDGRQALGRGARGAHECQAARAHRGMCACGAADLSCGCSRRRCFARPVGNSDSARSSAARRWRRRIARCGAAEARLSSRLGKECGALGARCTRWRGGGRRGGGCAAVRHQLARRSGSSAGES
jgi:hypothetical protein